MTKKYLALVLAACMTASLAACGSTAADTSAPAATTEEAADTAAAESTEAAATGEHGPSSEAAPAWEDYDARIAAIRSETDLAKREALMHEAEDELMSTWAVVPLYYYNDSYLQKTDVENIYANLFGFKYFGFAKTPTNTLDLQIASEPDKLDPALNSTVDGACLAILNFSGLFAYDENGQLVPELADSYEICITKLLLPFPLAPQIIHTPLLAGLPIEVCQSPENSNRGIFMFSTSPGL